jgi:protein Mpv17
MFFALKFTALALFFAIANGYSINIGKLGMSAVRKMSAKIPKMPSKVRKNGGGNGGLTPPKIGLGASAAGDDKDSNLNPLASFLLAYDKATEKNPILIKGLTSFFGFSIGDLLAQKFLDKKKDIDWARLIRLASFGLIVHGPTGHFFYGFLDGKMPGAGPATVATKVAIDQIVWNPIFGCMFFTYMTLAEGKTFEDVVAKIKSDLWTAVRGSWTVWPIAHTINFAFIPNSQRLLYINSIQIFYNMFLSVIANKK